MLAVFFNLLGTLFIRQNNKKIAHICKNEIRSPQRQRSLKMFWAKVEKKLGQILAIFITILKIRPP